MENADMDTDKANLSGYGNAYGYRHFTWIWIRKWVRQIWPGYYPCRTLHGVLQTMISVCAIGNLTQVCYLGSMKRMTYASNCGAIGHTLIGMIVKHTSLEFRALSQWPAYIAQ
ncbi:hypothetical protein V1520DRAFT_383514 [Lipomyces starkeyi]